ALTFLALGLLAWRTVGRGLEVDIAPAAFATQRQQDLLAVLGQVSHQFAVVLVDHQRADRHAQEYIVRPLAVAIRTATILAALPLVDLGLAEVDQRVDGAVGHGRDTAALAPVTAFLSAERPELLAAKRGDAIAAIAGND